jgi:OmpA-OmpF porin, OOP family
MRLPLALVITGTLLAASQAHAADSGAFFGVGVGDMNTHVNDVYGSNYTFDEGDVGFKLFGGYKFFPWLSVEGAYIDGGSPEVKDSDGAGASAKLGIELQALVAAAVLTLPIGDRFGLFIKPGFAYWGAKTSLEYSDPYISFKEHQDDNGAAFFVGGGGEFNFTEHFGARLEYEWFKATPEYDDYYDEFVTEYDASAGFFSASFVYTF